MQQMDIKQKQANLSESRFSRYQVSRLLPMRKALPRSWNSQADAWHDPGRRIRKDGSSHSAVYNRHHHLPPTFIPCWLVWNECEG